MVKRKEVWLSGYYNPDLINDWEEFQNQWSMGPHAEPHWVWFGGNYYTYDQVKKLLKNKKYVKENLCGDICKDLE